MEGPDPLLVVDDLRTVFPTKDGTVAAVSGVSFHINRGEMVGIVGESGSGKSVTAMSIMRLLEAPAQILSGTASLSGRDLLTLPESEMRRVRGDEIAMIFQDPLSSLNPAYPVGWQVAEALRLHRSVSKAEAMREAISALERVGIPDAAARAHDFPHQFSGGMRQRVMIAMALITEPSLLIADEPTTALDVTIQAQILDLLRDLNRSLGMATLLITHNLGVVAQLCERTIVMYAGKIVEAGPTAELFADPQHPYTRLLLQAVPRMSDDDSPLTAIGGSPPDLLNLPQGCAFHPRCPFGMPRCETEIPELGPVGGAQRQSACWATQQGKDITPEETTAVRQRKVGTADSDVVLEVSDLVSLYAAQRRLGRLHHGPVRAVDGVSLEIRRGETLAVVGESGCGKTTLAQTIMRLLKPHSGRIVFEGQDITHLKGGGLRRARQKMALVFQDPYSSLNPRHTVGEIVGEPLAVMQTSMTRRARTQRTMELLDLVGLDPRFIRRYPHQFSGGQRQRVAIARALASDPTLLVCDEPTSALDVSIQAQVITLLERLQQELDLTYLFISHDLAVVRYLATRVAVMNKGQIVETAPSAELFTNPRDAHTRALIDAVLVPDPKRAWKWSAEGADPVRPSAAELAETDAEDGALESVTAETNGLVR